MKKYNKVLILVLVIGIFSSGVAAANSINGLFEGFPIINIFVNGKKIEGDVPAISFKGRTMVPVRFVSEELGANVQWDGKTSSVYITKHSSGEYTQNDIEKIKLYNLIANHYKSLENLGDALTYTSTGLSIAFDGIMHLNTTEGLIQAEEHFSGKITWYNNILQRTQDIITVAKAQGIDISDMNTILKGYSEAIDYYKIALLALGSYNNTRSELDFDAYLAAKKLALDPLYEQMSNATNKYYEFFNKIQNY